jgi:hypothetical protein
MSIRTVLRRSGSVAIVAGLVGLGLAAGLAFGAPAHATGSTFIEVKMPGQAAYASTAPTPLLNVANLTPGGSVSGTMQVRDASETQQGSGTEDSLVLAMINVQTGHACSDSGQACAGSDESLSDALRFTLQVNDPTSGATLLRSPETVGSLQDGVMLASNLSGGSEISVQLTASLPPDVGNDVEYGTLGFDLQLGLITVAGESSSTGSSTSASSAGRSPGSGGSTSGPGTGTTPTDTLVIGKGGGSLSYTGLPLGVMASIAAGLLGAGLVLVLAGRLRRRSRDLL